MKKLYSLLIVILLPLGLFAQSVFINEIHYDNDGADAGEGVEIAGPAGTDLSGWTLQPYNGNGGAPYSTTALSGTIPDQSNGFGTLWFPISGLQNGSPDGIALVDNSSTVIQFLSYEGSFTAVGGPADGVISEYIGVDQSSTSSGTTLQLQGTGSTYYDFSWFSGITQTRGLENSGQTLIDATPPEWALSYPTLTNILDTRGDLTVNMNEPGKVYFMVLADGETAPTNLELKAGVPYGGVTPIYPGSFDYLIADADQLFAIIGATPETAYDIYVVAEDAAENLQSVPVKFDVTTTAARSLVITSPVAEETYTTGQEITFTWTSANITNIYIGGFDYTHEEYFYITEDGSGNPVPLAASLGSLAFTIPNDAALDSLAIIMWDAADTSFKDIVTPVFMTDFLPPEIDETYPANNDVDIPGNFSPLIYFQESVFAGTGKIYLREEGGTLFEDFDISAIGPGQALEFVWDNYGIQINPGSDLLAGTKYYFEMDAGVVVDFFDNDFAGFTGPGTWSFTIEGTLAVGDDFADKLNIYPVPAINELTISNIYDIKSIEVLDLTGSRVFRTNLYNEVEYKLDLTTFPRGLYFLKLNSEDKVTTKKFIKK